MTGRLGSRPLAPHVDLGPFTPNSEIQKSSVKETFLFMKMDPTHLVVKPDMTLCLAIETLDFTE